MALLHVCFAPADRAWVLGRLLPGLGLADGEVRTREHDALGAGQLDELRRAVESSRYTVLIASRAAAFDALARAATGLAQYASFEDGAPRLLVVTRDFAPGSLLILDEAHAAAPSSESKYAIDSQTTRAGVTSSRL